MVSHEFSIYACKTSPDLYAVSQHGLSAASTALIHLYPFHVAQEDEVQIGVEFELVQQRRDSGRRVDGVGQRGR